MEVKSKKLPKSQIEIEFELTAEEFQKHFEHALEHLKHHIKVDGFRPGQAPAKMVEDKVKPEVLLMEAGDHAVQHVYTDYVRENKLEPIGQPEVSIIKILDPRSLGEVGAKGESHSAEATRDTALIFKAVITVLPDVELPDYKEIASKIKAKEISVKEGEIQDALNYLQKSRAKFTAKDPLAGKAEKGDFVEIEYSFENKAAPQNEASLAPSGREAKDRFILGEGGMIKDFEENVVGMKAGEEKEFSVKFPENSAKKDLAGKDIVFKVKMVSLQKMELPEINDEFAKNLGFSRASLGVEAAIPRLENNKEGGLLGIEPQSNFNTIDDLRRSLKDGMIMEKKEEEKQRNRGEILEKIVEKSKISAEGESASGGDIPEILIKQEQMRLLEDLKNKIKQMTKVSFEEYLATIKQTEEQIKETYQKEAEKRIRNFLVLRELGKKENIEVTDAEVEEEVNKALKDKTLRQAHGEIDISQFREYTKDVLYNEKVFQKLESFSV